MNFKHYILALCAFLTFDKAYAQQLCENASDTLSHNVEFEIQVICRPGDPDTFFGYNFTNSSGPYSDIYAGGWCVDVDRDIMCDGFFFVDTYSSYDDTIPEDAVDNPENLDLVNWLINNRPIGSEIDIPNCTYDGTLGFEEYQEAIWELVDDGVKDLNATDCVVEYLKTEAETYGQGYEIECNRSDAKIGVILIADLENGTITDQVMMAEINVQELSVCNCSGGGGAGGDPHFKTWSGEMYDFHGLCDLSLMKNPEFMDGVGMDVHIRSKKMKQFSFISTAAIGIGSETFEVAGRADGDKYWLNGKEGPGNGEFEDGASIAGYSITFRQIHSHQREYVIHLSDTDKIVFGTWRDLVRVDIKGASSENFHGSLGLMGSFDKGGKKIGRDGFTVFDDNDKFGMQWQVHASEARLFHEVDGPQHPTRCEIPTKSSIRRRLAESKITLAEAEQACSGVVQPEFDLCVFDVMATNDKDVAGAY